MSGNRNKYLFAVAALIFGLICNNAFADSGCIGNGTVTGNPAVPNGQMFPSGQVLYLLNQSFGGANGKVPLPYRYAVSNTSTGQYAIYLISAKYVQSPSGEITATPIFSQYNSGKTKSGLPPARSGCPKTDGGQSNGDGGGSGNGSSGGTNGSSSGGGLGGWGASCSVARVTVGDQVRTEIVCP